MTWYSNGSVDVANSQTVIIGRGTDFLANGVAAGDGFISSDGRTYQIVAVPSATQLILSQQYQGTTATMQSYMIQPTSTASYLRDLALQAGQLVNGFGAVRDGVGQGLFGDGSVAAPGVRFAADQDTGIYRYGPNALGVVVGGTLGALFQDAGISAPRTTGRSIGFSVGDDRFLLSNGQSVAQYGSTYDPIPGGDDAYSTLLSSFGGLLFATGSAIRWRLRGEQFAPARDAAALLGGPSNRLDVIYAVTGTINTSDERSKRWRGGLDAAELAAATEILASIGVYQLLDAIAAKGETARLHIGVKAQQVVSILEAHGLEPMRYAFICHDAWDGIASVTQVGGDGEDVFLPGTVAGDRYGIRYDELAMFVLAAVGQALLARATDTADIASAVEAQSINLGAIMARLTAAEAHIDALEAR